MIGIIFLDKVDAAPLDNDDFSYPFNAWCANTTDALNEDIQDIQDQLNGFSMGTYLTQKTTVQITALISRNAVPILPLGTVWFDTTAGKIKVLTTIAVAGVSDGITQTVTSV